MSKQARELAELMGYERQNRNKNELEIYRWLAPDGTPLRHEFTWSKVADAALPAYDTDRNAMREVHKVLHERGLWDEFEDTFFSSNYIDYKGDCNGLYAFLNDLPGQVQAAIQVLKEGE